MNDLDLNNLNSYAYIVIENDTYIQFLKIIPDDSAWIVVRCMNKWTYNKTKSVLRIVDQGTALFWLIKEKQRKLILQFNSPNGQTLLSLNFGYTLYK